MRDVLDVLLHAAAGVEQQAEVQRRRGLGVAGGEELDRLRLAFFDDLEVLRREAGDRRALLVGDDDAEVHQIDAGAEGLAAARGRAAVSAAASTSEMAAARAWSSAVTPRMTPSKDLVAGDSHDVRARLPSPFTPRKP